MLVEASAERGSKKGIMRGLLFDIVMRNPLGIQVCHPFKQLRADR